MYRELKPYQIERLKEQYPPGTRIKLHFMVDDPCPVEPGTCGTVRFVDDIGTLHCDFDNGRSLGVIWGVDNFTVIGHSETFSESKMTDMEFIEERNRRLHFVRELAPDQVDWIEEQYPPGLRIELHSLKELPNTIEPGTCGEVEFVDDRGDIHCRLDDGRTFGLIWGVDSFSIVDQEEAPAEDEGMDMM